jgi:hypothetical protein
MGRSGGSLFQSRSFILKKAVRSESSSAHVGEETVAILFKDRLQ